MDAHIAHIIQIIMSIKERNQTAYNNIHTHKLHATYGFYKFLLHNSSNPNFFLNNKKKLSTYI